MVQRRYYSLRTGKNTGAVHFGLDTLKEMFLSTYVKFEANSYFQEALGYPCVDAYGGFCYGNLGQKPESAILLHLRKPLKLDPFNISIVGYSEDDLFDMIEFLFDCVSRPTNRYYHDYATCGWHSSEYDRVAGREEYREEVNSYLVDYQEGYQLSEKGEVLALADPGLQPLLDAALPVYDPENAEMRVEAAKGKFRRHRSSIEDRKDAIRDLAAILEFLREKANKYLLTKKDDGDLLNIANNFAIRHHTYEQKSDYNRGIWYSWMFYFYLATIQAIVRVISEMESKQLTR